MHRLGTIDPPGERVALALPGPLTRTSGGTIYDRRIVEELRARGVEVYVLELSRSFPRPAPAALEAADEKLAQLPDGLPVIVDGLAFGAMPEIAERHASRLKLIALVHLPLAEAVGLDPESVRAFVLSERRSLAVARAVVVTGRSTIDTVAAYGVDSRRIVLIEPGTDRPARLAEGSGEKIFRILCVGSITPGKGHELLIRALSSMRDLLWRLDCVGSTVDAETDRNFRALLASERLTVRVRLLGVTSQRELSDVYASTDVLASASLRETYGMAVAEAVAAGLPVVATRVGAVEDILNGEAGLLVEPGDVTGLAAALRRVVTDAALRQQLREGARRARERLPTWERAATRMAALLRSVASDE
jgi:glycosyltransferase involved in cell wall biosynthesis